ncbi:MAG TPA: hypothetical protein VFV05_00840 [Methylomirabilota bacterium]|nr:hypothetical protein [Methylomirabilota bacterium]
MTTANPAPSTGETLAYRISSLAPGTTYFAVVTAVDFTGNESGCTNPASGVALADLSVSPATAVNLGSTTTGTTIDTTFTVQNPTTSSIAGTATVGSPFSVVSGAAFTLAPGASQAVVVRFLPTTSGSFASNVTFTANGDTLSRTVSATATATTATLAVTRSGTGGGTVTSAPAGIACGTDCTETLAVGTALTLTATAAAGSTFAGWSGGGCGGAGTCAVAVNANTTVTAAFNASTLSDAPAPVLSSLSPSSAIAGSTGFMLTVNGSGFASASVVRWNGVDRTTTFVSASQLRIAIAAADIATPGSAAVSAFTPAPGGGTSGSKTFAVTQPIAPGEIIVDNAMPGEQDAAGGRTFTGSWCLGNAANEFGGDSLRSCGKASATYRWNPRIPVAGAYDVYVWIPTHSARSTTVPITVAHATGATTQLFNERKAPGSWVLHGRYTFNAGTAGYVQASNAYGTVAADAVRFVPAQ